MELGIALHSNPFVVLQSTDRGLSVYYEVAESIVILARSEKPHNSHIRVYNTRTQKQLHNYDLFLSQSEALDDAYMAFTNYAVNISLHEGSRKLAVAFADGTVLLFDLLQRTPQAFFTWGVVGAEDVFNYDFTDVDVKQGLKSVLLQNGAKF